MDRIWKNGQISESERYIALNLKHIAMQLCTCTWIEIMTGAGITLYMLSLQNYTLAAVTLAAFGPLIGFHFAVDRLKPGNNSWEKDSQIIKMRSVSDKSWPDKSKDELVD